MRQKITFRMLLVMMAMLFCGSGAWAQGSVKDVLTATNLGLNTGGYSAFASDATAGFQATYEGNAMNGTGSTIQLRSKDNAGIVVTSSEVNALSITVDWNTETTASRILDVYGQNTPFKGSADLYRKGIKKIGSIDHSKGETTLTITEDCKYIGFRSRSGALYLNSVTIEWAQASEPVDPAKKVQTLSFGDVTSFEITEGETFTAPVLTGAQTAVTYESSNTAVATVDAAGQVTLAGATGTTNITANAAEDATYNAASASYTLTVKAAAKYVANIAEFLKVADKAVYTFQNPVVVVKQHNSDLWIKDATGYVNVHGDIAQHYNLGDEIPAGFSGALGEYKGVQQVSSPAGFQAASKTGLEVLPEEMQIAAITNADINKYVVLKSVSFSDKHLTDGTKSIAYFDKFNLGKFPTDGNLYDVVGIVNHYNALQILPIEFVLHNDANLKDQTLSFPEAAYTVKMGDAFTAPQVVGAQTEVTYASSDVKVATVDAATGAVQILAAGTTTITAAAAANAEYNGASASYTLTVLPNIIGQALPFLQKGGKATLGSNFIDEGLDQDYGSSDAILKFKKAGTKLTMVLGEAPATLSYLVRWNGSGTFGKFIVETSVDGQAYTALRTYENATFAAGNDINEVHIALDENVRYIRWSYEKKVDGNIGIGSIMVTKKGDAIANEVAVTEAGYATYCSAEAYVLPEGLTANFVTVEGQTAKLNPVFNAGDVVPANVPVLFAGAAGAYQLYTSNVPAVDVSKDKKNDLRGALNNDEIVAPVGAKLYILANDPVNGLGFYFQGVDGDGSKVSGLAGKAYLQVDAALAAVQGYRLDGEVTAIEEVEMAKGQVVVYTIGGVRVNSDLNNLPKGLYIVNGKKMLVK